MRDVLSLASPYQFWPVLALSALHRILYFDVFCAGDLEGASANPLQVWPIT